MAEVKKLDIPSRFAEIKSGLKTTAGLKKHELERYSVWYNYYKMHNELVGANKSDMLWVGEHWKTIRDHIEKVYAGGPGNTYRNHLEGLANVLLAIDKDKFKEITRPMFNLGLTTQQIIDKANEESTLEAREMANYVPYGKLVSKRDELATLWAADPRNLKLNMYHLILALNTYIPPLRLEWLDMNLWPPRLVDGKPKKVVAAGEPPTDTTDNFLWEEKPGQWAIVINHDKIEGKREGDLPRQIFRLNDEIPGVTDGHKLNEIINQSLTWMPRNYVLIGIHTKEAMGASGFGAAMLGMFKPKKPLQNLLRKAFINHWHRAKINGMELPESKLKAIADHMRHSLEVARGSYRKINLAQFDEPDDNKHDAPPDAALTRPPVPPPVSVAPLPPKSIAGPQFPGPQRAPTTLPIQAPRGPATLPIVPPRVPPPSMTPPSVGPPARPPARVAAPLVTVVEPPKPYFVPREYSAEYRLAHKESILHKKTEDYRVNKHKILRAKILGNLNNGVVKAPKKSSIVKYGLIQLPDTGKWYTSQAE